MLDIFKDYVPKLLIFSRHENIAIEYNFFPEMY
jgi:hypothetical protein